MFKISRLTDYGVVILRFLAEKKEQGNMPCSARDLSLVSGLPFPTVSKLLKFMARHKLIVAKRGASGGYDLLVNPKTISLLKLIEIFEGPPAVTSCMTPRIYQCQIHHACPQRLNWYIVHQKVASVLSEISLFELIKPVKSLPSVGGSEC